jgi:hypothetical protein
VPPAQKISIEVRVPAEDRRAVLEGGKSIIESVGRLDVTIAAKGDHVPQSAKAIVGGDIEALVWWRSMVGDVERLEMWDRIQEVTA